jgi:hypothetical protein
MSDQVDETPEDFTIPGPEIAGKQLTIRIGSYNYHYERHDSGTITFHSRSPIAIVTPDDEDPEPFNPEEYR